MCLAVAFCSLAALGQTAAPPPQKPEKALDVIRQLDMIVAKAEDSANPDLMETIKNSELLGLTVHQRIKVQTVTTASNGALFVSGRFLRPGRELSKYKTKAGREEIAKFNIETERLSADKIRYAKDLSRVLVADRSRVKRDRMREWKRWRQDRNKAQGAMNSKINTAAEQRKEYCTRIDVELYLPSDLAQRTDKAKLAKARSARITFKLDDVEIRPPLDELDEPARISKVKGQMVDLDDKYLAPANEAADPDIEKKSVTENTPGD